MSRLNIIFAAVAAALAALLLLEPAQTPAALSPSPLSASPAASIARIDLYSGDKATPGIQLRRQNARWDIVHPVKVAADSFAVGELLHLLETKSWQRFSADELDLAKLKLAPPLWRVTYSSLNDENAAQESFQIGAIESLKSLRYVLTGGTVHLVTDINPAPFDANYADLVARRLLPTTEQMVGLRLPKGAYKFVDDKWQDETGKDLKAADILMAHWIGAEAQWTSRPSADDFASVTSRVTVDFASQVSIDFLISQTKPRLILIRPDIDVLYNLPGSATAELLGSAP